VLYWVVNNLLSIAQQWVITKRVESGADAAALKAKSGSGLGEQAKKLLTLAKQVLPDSKNPGKRKK
jgi:membrane protein insertase Oxa1/YidC/SpoIIIJ